MTSVLLSHVKKDVSKQSLPPHVECKRAQSSGTVSADHQKEHSKNNLVGRRCMSLIPIHIQKRHKTIGFEQSPSTPASHIDRKPDNETNNQQRPQGKSLRTFATKKREFMKLRNNLMSQQNMLLEQYAALKELESKAGVTDVALEEMRVLSIKGWPAHDLLLLIRDDLAMPTNSEISGVIGSHVVQQIQAQLNSIPQQVLAMASEIMKRRLDLLTLLRSKRRADRNTYQANIEWKNKNAELDNESETLRKLVTGLTENLKAKIISSLELAKISWKDRDAIIKKIDKVQKENVKLLNKLEEVTKSTEPPVTEHKAEEPKMQQDLSEELKKERSEKESLKEVVSAAENMLRAARTKITMLERQLKDRNSEIEVVKRKHKELEQLYRHRESHFDTQSKKLLQVSKTGENAIDTLTRQRDALEMRVKELREQAEQAECAAAARAAEMRARTDSLLAKGKAQKAAEDRIFELENHIKQLQSKLSVMRESSSRLIDVQKQHRLDYVPSKEKEPSQRDTDLWKKLQATRRTLVRTEEALRQSRTEKDKFLDSLSKIAQSEGAAKEENLANELVSREKKIIKLQQIISEHQEKEKKLEQNVSESEKKIGELTLEVRRLRNYDCYSKEIPHQDLQTELLVLQTQVESLSRERKALVNVAASRALMLERHERAAALFAHVTRARKELEGYLENEAHPSTDSVPEATRSLSSICASGASVWSALKAERARVLALESAVLSQNLQLEREERVRTQLERRRAVLERELIRARHSSASNAVLDGPSTTFE
ncbi:ELKS/Rab6-interacting/CAST family member 1-like isoform X2 [Aricia agestis]|uniref:ELKS/Rab6-interacting/CAST family member 1-like isoform X2 n=1 Tax=Aricia agestis TaxID=91739 RepID=UPI001C20B287|nr:ELKS/Rab6-interacting/CAST family member 1-like isoform X2 [Aricia agestis]